MSVIDNVLTGLTRLGRSTFLEIALRVGGSVANLAGGGIPGIWTPVG
jgi:hypothetical protein